MAHFSMIVGLLVLTVTVLLNTRPAEAANCANDEACKNNGTCPVPLNSKPCVCGDTGYSGDFCEDKSGASTVACFSLMTLFVVMAGNLL